MLFNAREAIRRFQGLVPGPATSDASTTG